jgi:hypothetical protein
MSFSIAALLIRNLHDVFGENDPARRLTPTMSQALAAADFV